MTYENIFGLGFERATEPGPDVEFKASLCWTKRNNPNKPLGEGFIYRRPIKLQVDHRYVRRDGVVVKGVTHRPWAIANYQYIGDDGLTRGLDGRYYNAETESPVDLVTHIEEPETKEEQMKDTVIVNNVAMTYAQIEAAHAEMMKQKAGNEFKLGDIVKVNGTQVLFMITQIHSNKKEVSTDKLSWYNSTNCTKVTGTPEFMAQLRAILEGK